MPRIWLPFQHPNLPIVTARFRQYPFRVLVDSGAEISLVSPQTALELGLAKSGSRLIKKIQGSWQSKILVDFDSIGFAGIELAAFSAAISQVASLGLNIEMILGVNAFAKRRVLLDYIENRVYLME